MHPNGFWHRLRPQSPQLCQNGGLLVLSSTGETEKVGWMGEDCHVVFTNNPLNVKENDELALDFAVYVSHIFWSQ
jgi:hypothetical protein